MMNEKNGNDWAKWGLRFLIGGIWTAVIAVLLAFNARVGSAEKEYTELDRKQQICISDLQKCQGEVNVKLAYIEKAVAEQGQDIKAILKAVKQ